MDNDVEELKRRLEKLEEENRQLREGARAERLTQITSRISKYKGHPVITFEGPFRPFSLDVRKAAVVVERIDDVVAFVEKHGHKVGADESDDES